MVGHGGSSAGSYLANPTSPIPSHCALIVATSTLRINDKNTLKLLLRLYTFQQLNVPVLCYSHQHRKMVEGQGAIVREESMAYVEVSVTKVTGYLLTNYLLLST